MHDIEGNELPRLVYVSREKRPGFDHHKKAGAMNALVQNLLIFVSLHRSGNYDPLVLNGLIWGFLTLLTGQRVKTENVS